VRTFCVKPYRARVLFSSYSVRLPLYVATHKASGHNSCQFVSACSIAQIAVWSNFDDYVMGCVYIVAVAKNGRLIYRCQLKTSADVCGCVRACSCSKRKFVYLMSVEVCSARGNKVLETIVFSE
jgi:hypothetical protein